MKKTTKLIGTALSTIALTTLGACGNSATPNLPKDKECKNWKLDEKLDTYKCSDKKSKRSGSYYYGGHYYASSSALKSSSSFKAGTKSSSAKASGSKSGVGGGKSFSTGS